MSNYINIYIYIYVSYVTTIYFIDLSLDMYHVISMVTCSKSMTPMVTRPFLHRQRRQDAPVPEGPSDSISCLRWSPAANIFACGSWDKSGSVRCGTSISGMSDLCHVYLYIYIHIYVCYTHIDIYYIDIMCKYIYIYICICICICMCKFICICVYLYVYVFIYMYMCIFICICVYLYVYVYI